MSYMREFKYRTYTIDLDKGVFVWRTCKKRTWFKKKCKEWFTSELDFADRVTRQRLIDAGFVLTVRERP